MIAKHDVDVEIKDRPEKQMKRIWRTPVVIAPKEASDTSSYTGAATEITVSGTATASS